MLITKIVAENFKSYKKIDVSLNNLNFIIGGNASGKSNFVNLLKFFNDMIEYGLEDAVLLQGGIKYLFNSNSKKSSSLKMEFKVDLRNEQGRILDIFPIEKLAYLPSELDYYLKIKPNERGDGYKVNKEKIIISFDKLKKIKGKFRVVDQFTLNVEKDSNNIISDDLKEKEIDTKDELIAIDLILRFIRRDGLLLSNFFHAFSIFNRYDNKIKIYNFDVNLLKSPSSIVARSELEDNGANLVNIIQQLLRNKDKKNKLNRLIKMILPFVEDIKVENNVNKSLFFKVKESYNNSEFPSYMLSDGTVNILAVIVALYFQDDNEVIVLEEPERNIHPKLLSTLVSILGDVSSSKQIFLTTHNPYIIKEANLEDVILVSRNNIGESKVSRPIDDDKIKAFLQNDLGIEDLFVDGILK